jgi:transcriptional regulator with XRE-family HTH domain
MDTIRDLRAKLALTQAQFANRLGVTSSTVYKWEAREVEPTARQLRSIARLADADMDLIDFDAINRKSRAKTFRVADPADPFGDEP